MDYKSKYLKYKSKYLAIKNQYGGMDPADAGGGKDGSSFHPSSGFIPPQKTAPLRTLRDMLQDIGKKSFLDLLPNELWAASISNLKAADLFTVYSKIKDSIKEDDKRYKSLLILALKQKNLDENDFYHVLRDTELLEILMEILLKSKKSKSIKSIYDFIYWNRFKMSPVFYVPVLIRYVSLCERDYLLMLRDNSQPVEQFNEEPIEQLSLIHGKIYGFLTLFMLTEPNDAISLSRDYGVSCVVCLYFADSQNTPVNTMIMVNSETNNGTSSCALSFVDNGTRTTVNLEHNLFGILDSFKTKIAENMGKNLRVYKCVLYYKNYMEDVVEEFENQMFFVSHRDPQTNMHPLQTLSTIEGEYFSEHEKIFEVMF